MGVPLALHPHITFESASAVQNFNVATSFEEEEAIPERGRGVSRVEEIRNIYESKIKGEDLSKTEKGTANTEPQRGRGESRVSDLKKMYESMADKK